MQIERATLVDPTQYVALFVGLGDDGSSVHQIWLRADGSMVSHERIHYPKPGRTAAGEAITAFGLFRFRRFDADEIEKADAYQARLSRELEDDAPRIL
jgi:hypothetical protein